MQHGVFINVIVICICFFLALIGRLQDLAGIFRYRHLGNVNICKIICQWILCFFVAYNPDIHILHIAEILYRCQIIGKSVVFFVGHRLAGAAGHTGCQIS